MNIVGRVRSAIRRAAARVHPPARRWLSRGAALAAAGGALWTLTLLVNVSEFLDLFSDDPVPATTARTEARVAALDAKIDLLTARLIGDDAGAVERATVRDAVAALVTAADETRASASARLEAGDLAGAEAGLHALVTAQAAAVDSQAETWMQLAAVRRASDLEGALDAYEKAANLQPGAWRPLLMQGLVLLELDEPERAAAAFEAALARAPDDARLEGAVYGNLGNAMADLKKTVTARRYYEASLEIHERLGLAADAAGNVYNIGILDELVGRYDDACARWADARLRYAALEHPNEDVARAWLQDLGCTLEDGAWVATDLSTSGFPWPDEG
jgi:tetratricopeptide (TPR) repeat protein